MKTLLCFVCGPLLAVAAGEISQEEIYAAAAGTYRVKTVAMEVARVGLPACSGAACAGQALPACAGRAYGFQVRYFNGRGPFGFRFGGRVLDRRSARSSWRPFGWFGRARSCR